jgi:hypothetical protein
MLSLLCQRQAAEENQTVHAAPLQPPSDSFVLDPLVADIRACKVGRMLFEITRLNVRSPRDS